MSYSGVWVLLAGGLSIVSCAGGTETDNPATLKDFSSSTCKNEPPNPGQQELVLEADADGLQCIDWAVTGDTLQIQLINFPERCADRYLGKASLTGDTLELSVYNNICAVAACGSCVFDFDYEISGVRNGAPLRLRIGAAICEQEPTVFSDELTLPLNERSSGVVCRPIPSGALTWLAHRRSACGERNMPCGDCSNEADTTSCDPGLICTELAEGDARCLATCASDNDCAGALSTCEDGVCRASSSW